MILSDKAVEVAARKLVLIYGGNPDELIVSTKVAPRDKDKVAVWTLFAQSVYEFSAMQEALKAGISYDNSNPNPEL